MKKIAKMVLGAIPATLTIGVAINAVEDFFQKKADKAKADEAKADEMKAV